MSTYLTLQGKSLEELPAIPTNLEVLEGVSTVNVDFQNNNTLTGCTVVGQNFNSTNSIWVDNVAAASSATTITLTGLTSDLQQNVRVAMKKTSTGRYYPSIPKLIKTLNPVPQSGLISRWQFEDNLNDTQGSYNLTGSGTFSYNASGKNGKAWYSSNSNPKSYAYSNTAGLKNIFANKNNFSFSFWFYRENNNNGIHFLKFIPSTNSLLMSIETNGGLYFTRDGNGHLANTPLSYGALNTWFHVVYTYDGTTTKIYVNAGTPYQDTTLSNHNVTVTGSLYIVDSNYTNNTYRFDQAYVYNRAISALEVSALYNGGLGV